MQTIRQVARSLLRRRMGLAPVCAPHLAAPFALVLGQILALAWFLTIASLASAAPLQQETPSPSPTASPGLTLSPSPTQTLTSTLGAATATLTPTASPNATSTPPFVPSPTWTEPPAVPAPTEPFPTAAPAPLEPGPTVQPTGPTPTLLPLPSVTYQFPGVTPRGDLLSLAQPTAAAILPKGGNPFVLRLNPGRGWFLWLIPALWVGLLVWFAIAQIIARRR